MEKTTSRGSIRKAFKDIGYKAGFKRNSFNDGLVNITFIPLILDNPTMKPVAVSSSECYGKDTYEKHKQAFELAMSFNQFWLEDTEQKIV